MKTNDLAHTAPAAVMQVLTDTAIFHAIVDWIDGVPRFVLEFYETAYQEHCERTQSELSELRGMPRSVDSIQPTLWFAAVVHGNIRVLKTLDALAATPRYKLNVHMAPLEDNVGIAVADTSDLSVLDWVYDRYPDAAQRHIRDDHFELLAHRCDAMAVVEWIHAHDFAFPAQMITVAAGAGNLALVRFLHERELNKVTHEAQGSALRNGHLAVLQYLHEHCNDAGCASDAVTIAAKRGHLDCVKFASEHDIEGFTVATMSEAASCGRLDVVKYLHETRTEGCTVVALVKADSYQHHDVVDFLCHHRPMKNAGPVVKRATSLLLLRLAAKLATSMIASHWSEQYEYY